MSFELLQQYLEHASLQQECITAEGYFKWIPQCSNMQMFLSEAVFTFFLSLNVFRAGIRRNNSDIINVAKTRFAPPLLWTEHAFLYGNVFQGFSTADKMSTIVV